MEAQIELVEHVAEIGAALDEAAYDEAPVRAYVVALARCYGGLVLDLGTAACACMAVVLACCGLQVTAVDSASGAIRMAKDQVTASGVADRLEVRHADVAYLPFSDGSYGSSWPLMSSATPPTKRRFCQRCSAFVPAAERSSSPS